MDIHKQLSKRFPDLLCNYTTKWSEPFDFLLQEESTVIDIDKQVELEKVIKKTKSANEHGYKMIRICGPFDITKLEFKDKNQFICKNNEYDLNSKKVNELKEIAKNVGIPKSYTLKREELIKILSL